MLLRICSCGCLVTAELMKIPTLPSLPVVEVLCAECKRVLDKGGGPRDVLQFHSPVRIFHPYSQQNVLQCGANYRNYTCSLCFCVSCLSMGVFLLFLWAGLPFFDYYCKSLDPLYRCLQGLFPSGALASPLVFGSWATFSKTLSPTEPHLYLTH